MLSVGTQKNHMKQILLVLESMVSMRGFFQIHRAYVLQQNIKQSELLAQVDLCVCQRGIFA